MGIVSKNIASSLVVNKKRIFLWNWFTQAYYKDFSYTTLFDAIKDVRENERIKKIFEYFWTSNFEEILSKLKSLDFFSGLYEFDSSKAQEDYGKIQDSLAQAIVSVHPEKTTEIPEQNKVQCLNFLQQFDDIFTVNYDLLTYWVLLHDPELKFWDYFNRDSQTPDNYCEYFKDWSKSDKHIYNLHWALHLFLKNWSTTKKVWWNTAPLISQIKTEMENNYYPLVVAEGDHSNKLKMIKSNPYLYNCYSKFSQSQGNLFTFGFSFSDQDTHIINSITENVWLKYLWIWIRWDFSKEKNQKLYDLSKRMETARRDIFGTKKESKSHGLLSINFYDSESVDIWWNK